MPQQVRMGATLSCSFGVAPSTLTVISNQQTMVEGPFAATIMDHAPIANIAPFGMCTTPTNPQVAAATTAALGILTPQPCIPVTTAPWTPGSLKVKIGGQLALNSTCQLMCQWGGVIAITNPGQVSVNTA